MRMWDLDDLAGIGDLARSSGVGLTAASKWRTADDFPAPLVALSTGPVYSRSQVAAWQERNWPDGAKARPRGRPQRRPSSYEHITDDLRSRIRTGEWAPGDKLPSRIELGRQYGVSEYMMSHPINQLRREGLVTSARGSGTYVTYSQARTEE